MTVSWRPWPRVFCICLLLCATEAVTEDFQLEPLNTTVLRGSAVHFNATVQGKWQVMTWTVQGFLVLTATTGGNVTSASEQFSARFCSSGDSSCVEFTIHNVTRRDSGPVVCTVQGKYRSKTAHLYVQESGKINIIGGNMRAVQGQQVEFQCETFAWYPIPTFVWTRNGQVVNSSLYNTSSTAVGDSFNSISVLKFKAVSNTTVECLVTVPTLPEPQVSSVFLTVVPKPPNWTVLIAVVVCFGGCGLLVLLIIGIIFCYKRRKEKQPNYQDEMSRRVRTQSQISVVSGQANAGYMPDDHTSVAPSELTDKGFSQESGTNMFEMPDVVKTRQARSGYSNVAEQSGFKKHRHVTIV